MCDAGSGKRSRLVGPAQELTLSHLLDIACSASSAEQSGAAVDT